MEWNINHKTGGKNKTDMLETGWSVMREEGTVRKANTIQKKSNERNKSQQQNNYKLQVLYRTK
jgi:uncharacterized protein YaiI (UPF0178 family)